MTATKQYSSERLATVILAPVVSEKGTFIADKHNQVVFRVVPNATKPEVKAAVELMFKTQVEWMTAATPEDEVVKVMERAGLGGGQCLTDGRLFDKVVGDVQSGQALGVKFTPTLFINEQKYGNPEGGILGIDAILRQVGR